MATIRHGDVYVDTQKLSDLALDFDRWVDELDKVIPGLETMRFTPGSVPNAFHLKRRFKNYVRDGYVGSLANLRKSFADIAKELTVVAKGYTDTETTVTSDVERLAKLLDAAKKPFDPTDVPDPQNPNNNQPQGK